MGSHAHIFSRFPLGEKFALSWPNAAATGLHIYIRQLVRKSS